MKNKNNHVCQNPECGKKYHFCRACVINPNEHWGNVACSPECYKRYLEIYQKTIDKK